MAHSDAGFAGATADMPLGPVTGKERIIALDVVRGVALFGMIERYEMYYVVLAIWILQLIVSPIWLKYFRFGPAEWLWRSLTYMKKQPMSRAM